MNLPKLRRANTKRIILGLTLTALILASSRLIWGNPGSSSIDDILLTIPGNSSAEITLAIKGDLAPGDPTWYGNPSRLVYDFKDTILTYKNGAARKFPIEVSDLNAIGISQFQRHPDIVRLVMYFKGGTRDDILKSVSINAEKGKLVIKYIPGNGKAAPTPVKAENESSKIEKLLHQRVGPDLDRFTFKGSIRFEDPKVRFVAGGLILSFKDVLIDLPSGSTKDFLVPVSGNFVDEIQIVNQSEGATVFLRLKDPVRTYEFNYEINRVGSSELRFDLKRSYQLSQEEKKPDISKPITSSGGKITGLVQVLGSGMDSREEEVTGDEAKIVRIQYQPLSIGERFILEVKGDFKPQLKKLKYPNRLILESANTTVVLPKGVEDRFQVKIEGALSKLMKVFLKTVEDTHKAVIEFYYETAENEDIQYNFYATETENIYYLDVLPVAAAFKAKPTEIPREPVKVPKIAPPATPPVEQPKPEPKPEVKETKPVEQPKETVKEENKESEKSEFMTFSIPKVDTEEPVVKIPSSESKEEAKPVEEKKEEKAPKAPETKVEKKPEPVKPVETPKPVVEKPKKEKPVETPKVVAPGKAPIIIEYLNEGGIDRFIITSTEPITNYKKDEMNFPTRLAVEFPGRVLEYKNIKQGKAQYLKGSAFQGVRIIERDYPSPRSIFFVNMKYGWDTTEYRMSGSPDRIVVDISATQPEAPMVAKKPETLDTTPKMEEVKPVAEPPKIVEVQSEKKPSKETREEELKPVEELSFVLETPELETEEVADSFTLDQREKEPIIEEKPAETPKVETVKPSTPPEPPRMETPRVEEKIKEKPAETPKVEKVKEKPAVPEVKTEKKAEETIKPKPVEEKIEIKIVDNTMDKSEKEEVIAMYHPSDEFPLRKGEIVKPSNCIGSIEMGREVGNGIIKIESTGAYLPKPEVVWFNYPTRLNFVFEGVGVNIEGSKQPDLWKKKVDSDEVSTIQAVQQSGDRIPLSATISLFVKPGIDRTNMEAKVVPLSDKSMKIELVKGAVIGQPGASSETKIIKITDEDFKIKDLEKGEKPVQVEKIDIKPVEPAKTEEAKVEETKPEATTEPAKETVTRETPKGSVTIEKGPEPLITIILQNAEIEDVLFLIAENTGIDISVESRSIKGKISLKVTKKPVSEVFNLIATQGNFKWNKYNDIYIFGSEQFIWSFPGVIKPKVVRLKYSDPMKVRQVLTQMRLGTQNNVTLYQAPNISGTGGRLNVPTAQDAIVLKGDEKLIAQMLDVIRQIDVPPLLIKVNMKVIEYSLTDNKNIGFNWKNVTGGGTLDKGVISFNLQEKFNTTEGELPLQGFKRGSSIDFNMVFNYLLDQGSAKILADSTLNVTNGGRGEFFVGEKIPYRSTFQVSDFGRVTQRIQNEDVGISMRFKAQAADDNMITLYLDPDLTNLKEITDIGPRTSKKNFTTTVRIQSGQAYAIGGLINESDRVTYDKVPFLGDLPLLGKFFKSKNTQKNRSELIVIFTPEIVRDAALRMYDLNNEDQYPVEGNAGSSFSLSN